MKHLVYLILAILMMACAERSHNGSKFFYWESTTREFDYATQQLDSLWAIGDDIGKLWDKTCLLESIQTSTGGTAKLQRLMKGRVQYYKGRWKSAYSSTYSESLAHLDSALYYYGDSAAYPYAYNRIDYIKGLMPIMPLDKVYHLYHELADYFKNRGDSIMYGVSLTMLGSTLISIGDTAASVPHFEKAIKILDRAGMDRWALKFRLSLAQCHYPTNPAKSRQIIEDLRHNKNIQQDSVFYNILLHISYTLTRDISIIEDALRYIGDNKEFDISKGLYKAYIAKEHIRNGTATGPTKGLIEEAISKTAPSRYLNTELNVSEAAAAFYSLYGPPDSAIKWLNNRAEILEKIARDNSINKIHQFETRLKIAENESRMREKAVNERLLWGIIVLSTFFVASLIVITLYRHNKRLQLQRIKSELDLTRHKLTIASTAAIMEEKDKVMETVLNTVNTLRTDNKINDKDAQLVSAALKVHAGVRDELKSFQEVYQKIHPSFKDRLKKDFPNLSESNIRLASYICIGMNNRQIARVSGIEYKSVMTARHRLRQKMHLPAETMLEDALRAYGEIPPDEGDSA